MTNRQPIPFARPEIGEAEIAEVVDTLRSGWLTSGPKVKLFEEKFSGLYHSKVGAVAVSSATAGLHLALEACGIGPGDEVIVPTFTFTATAEVVAYLHADPVFVDVDPSSLNIRSEDMEPVISERTKAVIVVHYGGLSCDMAPIIKLARKHGLSVIEDAAHALPARYGESLIGELASDVTVFSFYANKTMTTGEGGMIVSRDDELLARCRVMRLHGISKDVFDRYNRPDKTNWYYEVVAPGYKYNMMDMAAAVGIHQLDRIYDFRARRDAVAEVYNKAFASLDLQLPALPEIRESHAWHLYPVRLGDDFGMTRDEFITEMTNQRIGTSVHFIPLHFQPVWKERYDLDATNFPVATDAYERIVSLPIFSAMSHTEAEVVVDVVTRLSTGRRS